jgi:hypothetical protein
VKLKVFPREGKWTVRNEYFTEGKSLDHWGFLDLANINERAFFEALRNEGRLRGLAIANPADFKKADELRAELELDDMYRRLAKVAMSK